MTMTDKPLEVGEHVDLDCGAVVVYLDEGFYNVGDGVDYHGGVTLPRASVRTLAELAGFEVTDGR